MSSQASPVKVEFVFIIFEMEKVRRKTMADLLQTTVF